MGIQVLIFVNTQKEREMGLFSKGPDLNDVIFQLRMSSKQLEREAKRAEKEEKAMRKKVKKAIKDQRIEFAQIHAESAIRKKNEGLNYLRLASRVDAVASKVKSAQGMKNVTKTMGQTTKQLDAAMKSMNLEKITATMDKFEKSFENLDLTTQVMDGSMGDAMATSAPSGQVDALIQQVADENNLQIANDMAAAPIGNSSLAQEQKEAQQLDTRLAQLRS